MSTFWTKIAQGDVPTEADWTEHLIEAHQAAPSMTPRAFAAHKTRDGQTSYELLAHQIENDGADIVVVDLACGDGYLTQFLLPRLGAQSKILGVDMSEAELGVARTKVKDPRASFFCAKADNLPFPAQSANLILSHMAFMLMAPLEPVVAEISRVLKKGGRFVAITGNPNVKPGVYAEIQKLIFGFTSQRYTAIREAKTGDKRIYTREGLGEVFHPSLGFSELIDLGEFELRVGIDPEGLWNFMKEMYFVGMLPENEKKDLHAALLDFASSRAGDDGKLRFEFPLRGFGAKK